MPLNGKNRSIYGAFRWSFTLWFHISRFDDSRHIKTYRIRTLYYRICPYMKETGPYTVFFGDRLLCDVYNIQNSRDDVFLKILIVKGIFPAWTIKIGKLMSKLPTSLISFDYLIKLYKSLKIFMWIEVYLQMLQLLELWWIKRWTKSR